MPSPSPCNCSASVGTCSPHHLKLFIICRYVPSPSPQTDHQWLHALPNPQTVHHLWLHALPNPLKLFIVTLPNPTNCSSYVGTCHPQPLQLFIICGYTPSPTPQTVHLVTRPPQPLKLCISQIIPQQRSWGQCQTSKHSPL